MRFLKIVHRRVESPGVEWQILKKLPRVSLAGTFLPLIIALLARVLIDDGTSAEIAKQIRSIDIFCIALLLAFWTILLTVGVGCLVVFIMKGPAYAADSYAVSHADRPGKSKKVASSG